MKIKYSEQKFYSKNIALIEKINSVIEEYQQNGYQLTLRQCYYQLVSRGFIENTEKSYKNTGDLINNGRLAGLIDWDAITDRTRNLKKAAHFDSPQDIIFAAANQYKIDKWQNQPNYVEVWIEKDALIDIVQQACKPLDVPYFSCRGYCSQSEMWTAAQRFIKKENHKGRFIIHLGDHDPSGIDMTRDISERLKLFGANVEIRRVALTMEQILELQPPPNPAKITDNRADKYITEFGYNSWELDALPPDYIQNLITTEILNLRDDSLYKIICQQEQEEKATVKFLADNFTEFFS